MNARQQRLGEIASTDGVVVADSSRYGRQRQRARPSTVDAEIPRRVDDCYDSGQQWNVFDDDLIQLLFGAQPHHLCLRRVEL